MPSPSAASSSTEGRRRASAIAAACALLASLSPAPASAAEKVKAAVLVTQSLNVGDLADRVGLLAADILRGGPLEVIAPKDAASKLAAAGGPDPIECGTDNACLTEAGRKLGVRWVIAVGIGKLGEYYGLDVRALDAESVGLPRTYQQSYKEPGPDWTNATHEAVRKVVPAELLEAPKDTSIEVVSNVDGATVFLDGFPAGTTPRERPIATAAGPHAIELRKDGHSSARREVTLAAGASERLELYLVPLGEEGGGLGRTFGFVSAGVGAAALGTAIFFHVQSLGSADEANQLNREGLDFTDAKERSLSEIGTARILYGVAGVAAVGATVLFLTSGGDDEPARSPGRR